MANKKSLKRFENLNYEDFRVMASDSTLSQYEKIGFPDSYRKGKEPKIFEDILNKVPAFSDLRNKKFVDIGCGCSGLVNMIISHSKKQHHELHLIDSKEMLDQLKNLPKGVHTHPGFFPDMADFIQRFSGKIDGIFVYSVFHYIIFQNCIYKFIDEAVSMLNTGGILFIGDIPNQSKRNRFFSTPAGLAYHQKYTGTKTSPKINPTDISNKIDDAVIFSILQRYRNAGYETYLLPQNESLAMANRREDIIIQRIS